MLSLKANPTFTAKVGIPIAGGKTETVKFTFKHRTRSEFDAFTASMRPRDGDESTGLERDVEYVIAVASGWELADEFNKDNVEVLLQNYYGAAAAIATAYTRELIAAKAGN